MNASILTKDSTRHLLLLTRDFGHPLGRAFVAATRCQFSQKDFTLLDPEILIHAHVTGASDVMLESYFDLLKMTLIEAELIE